MWLMVLKTVEGKVLVEKSSLATSVRAVPAELNEGIRKGVGSPNVDCKYCI